MDEHKNYIRTILDRRACKKHRAPVGEPCWKIYGLVGLISPAVCNTRARSTGFSGRISLKSLGQS